MKKLLILILLVSLCCATALASEDVIPPAEIVDSVTTASVADYYGAFGLSGQELMDAINSQTGFYLVSTVNEDLTPNAAFFIFGCVEDEGKYYIQLGIAENQTRQNILRTGEAVAVYGVAPGADAPFAYATSGARMKLQLVTDEAFTARLNTTGYPGVLFAEIVEVRPLG